MADLGPGDDVPAPPRAPGSRAARVATPWNAGWCGTASPPGTRERRFQGALDAPLSPRGQRAGRRPSRPGSPGYSLRRALHEPARAGRATRPRRAGPRSASSRSRWMTCGRSGWATGRASPSRRCGRGTGTATGAGSRPPWTTRPPGGEPMSSLAEPGGGGARRALPAAPRGPRARGLARRGDRERPLRLARPAAQRDLVGPARATRRSPASCCRRASLLALNETGHLADLGRETVAP